MGAAGYGYPHGYPDNAATTALPQQADPHTSMLPPSREDDGGYGYDDRPDRRRQKKGGSASTVLLVVAGILVLIGAIFLGKSIFGGDGAGTDAKVPNFVGKTYDEATTTAGNVDLKVVKGAPEFCEGIDKDLICKQTPAADTALPSDKTVTVVLSKGAAPIPVPDVKNDKVADAEAELRSAGFDVKKVDQVSTTKDPGIVVGQDPAAGSKQPKGTVITLKVTVEPEKIDVPDLTRYPEKGARDQLSNLGFTNIHITRQPSDDPSFPDGTVISQTPPGGSSAAKGDSINLVISTGSPQTQNPPQGQTMPRVQFRKLGEVQDQLNGMNLGLSVVVVNGGPEDRNSWVIGSNPGEGTPLTQGEQIQLQTAANPGGGGQ
jgi:serine/threonine-protein kinase